MTSGITTPSERYRLLGESILDGMRNMRHQFEWPHHNDPEATDLAWSEIVPGTRIRWVTPAFVRRGTVISREQRSVVAQFDGLDKKTTIPDAKWYFIEWRHGRTDEHLVSISTPAPKYRRVKSEKRGKPSDALITPAEAAAILGTDSKTIRRKLRSGSIKGERTDSGSWLVDRRSLRT